MSTPGSPVVQHAYLVAHQDARFESNFRDTYALTLVTKDGMRLCHMASTWRSTSDVLSMSTSDVRATCLHGSWCEASHPSDNFKLRASFRYSFQSQESTPDFFVPIEVTARHPFSSNIYIDKTGNRLFLDMLAAREDDHTIFNALVGANTNGLPDHLFNVALYNRLVTQAPAPSYRRCVEISETR